ncbi:ATP-binding protein [Streptococcus danieliae]|uniref:ATP-binding protein n=1 Tax=Streptococcus danieliae TaxID=747656 RepID=UPI0021C75FEE|nr:ATP-binding protein [Streptococcus danieliae]MCU0081859.1 ATP-binding protein [Streptococcus danieliae]
MQANYKNIGLIADAEIELNGITVIAAPNNSGKSSLSKTLYMFLETLNSFQEEYTLFRDAIIDDSLTLFFRFLNRKIDYETRKKLIGEFHKRVEINGIDNILEVELDEETESVHSYFGLAAWFNRDSSFSLYLKENIEILKDICYEFEIESEGIDLIEDTLSYFEHSPEKQMELVLGSKVRSYFDDDLISRNVEGAGHFSLSDNQSEFKNLILQSSFDKSSRITDLMFQTRLYEFREVLYIDSFIDLENYSYRQYYSNIASRGDVRGKSATTFRNLIESRENVNPLRPDIKIQEELLLDINQIIEGSVERSNENIVYTRNHQQFSLKNTATGIKIFGVLQLLLRNYQMTSDLFLIIDEPETNLHPVWQVKLAEIIVLLNKRLGTRFMINSHSSNFIEGIKLYSELYDCEHQVEFYLINPLEKKNHSVRKVTTNIQLAYNQLNGSLDLLDDVSERILNKNRER